MKPIEYIPGSDKGSVYRVLAKKGRVRLAIKPIIHPQIIGWNARAAVPAEEVGDITVTQYEITGAFPKIHFAKKDDTRASKAFVMPLPFKPTNPKQFVLMALDFLTDKDSVMSVVKPLLDKMDTDLSRYASDNEIADWFAEQLSEEIGAAKKKMGLAPNFVEEAAIKIEINNILNNLFNPKA